MLIENLHACLLLVMSSFFVKLFCQSQTTSEYREVSKGKVQPLFCSESLPIQGTRVAIKAKKIQLKKSGPGKRQRTADAVTLDEGEMLHEGSDHLLTNPVAYSTTPQRV